MRAAETYRTDYHLLDAYRPDQPGGTGESFDWELAAGHARGVPLILAGGLNPANVAEAIAAAHPYAVDVASGVEAEPRRKDPDLLGEFFDAVRSAVPTGSTAT